MKIKVKSVEVAKAIQSITELGAIPMLPKREFEAKELSSEEIMKIQIIVPLVNENNEHEDGFTTITVGDIKINESHGSWLFCDNKNFSVVVAPNLFKPRLRS